MTRVVLFVAVVVFLGVWATWTATRLDRLRYRVDTAWATLDAHLVRRAAAATELAAHVRRNALADEELARALERAGIAASRAAEANREAVENDLSRAARALLAALPPAPAAKTAALLEHLLDASTRVGFARQFYNDAVRDNRRLRRRWLPRLLTIRYRHDPGRDFFEIDDTALGAAPAEVR